jgi:hypothetical protein
LNTRGLHGLYANRISGDNIALEYDVYTDSGDGSAIVIPHIELLKGSVTALQPRDIERLEKAGIVVKNGVTIVIPECPKEQPDRIAYDDTNYRVVNWTFEYSYTLGSGDYGTVITTCDEMPIQNAEDANPGGSSL